MLSSCYNETEYVKALLTRLNVKNFSTYPNIVCDPFTPSIPCSQAFVFCANFKLFTSVVMILFGCTF